MAGKISPPPRELLTPVQYLKGVGPQRAALLNRLGMRTAADVLFNFPRDYQDLSRLLPIGQLAEGQPASICGTVEDVSLHNTGPGRSVLGVLVRDETEHLRAVWFNQPYLRRHFYDGQRVLMSGTVRIHGLRPEMHHPRVETLADDEDPPRGTILPVYRLTEGLNQHHMRRIAQRTVGRYAPLLEETFPPDFLQAHDLWPIAQALPELHFPSDEQSLARARRRFVYQELLVLQLALALRKASLTTDRRAPRLATTAQIDARIRRLWDFQLTGDQERAIAEITADMDRDHPMNRLLHGEVGSGKTAVAVYAMLVAVANRHQAALMAPTEVLAQQHWRTLGEMLRESQVRMALLSGGLTAAQRRDTLERIAAGEVDLVVGTHAVVQSDVRFARLGLVVIDEQHKFGVRQRATLRGKEEDDSVTEDDGVTGRQGDKVTEEERALSPHYLVMTATPIPRTVALSMFGDLEVSTLRQVPPGRQKVHAYVIEEGTGDTEAQGQRDEETRGADHAASRTKWWEFFRKKLREGRQGYVIAPLVDDAPEREAASVQAAHENLANGELAEFRLDVVHGRMNAEQKQAVMEAFRRGETQVLIATSVVEVGVDVPGATLMTIEDAQRFGLAQLHQLRGRVSRGTQPGYVCAFATTDNPEALKRLAALAQTSDGFELAEIDFRLRGPGDLLGTRQHGLPPLRIADLQRDQDELEQARADALQLVNDQARWESDEYARLRGMVLRRYGDVLQLGDVG